jgi:hydroxymethylpyrimidine pyrophosphatase-like HAD family hydrolase
MNPLKIKDFESDPATDASPGLFLAEESRFYADYPWCINASPSLEDIIVNAREELSRCNMFQLAWCAAERLTNVFLLCCAISDIVDDWILGERYDFSKARLIPLGGVAIRPLEIGIGMAASVGARRRKRLELWRDDWETALETFLRGMVLATVDAGAVGGLKDLLQTDFPPDLLGRRCRIPAAFRSQDLCSFDILSLAEKFASMHPDTSRPVLALGCRTAGSYFAPLLCAYLKTLGFRDVSCVTVRPKKGLSTRERAKIAAITSKRGLVVMVDEPVNTGNTLTKLVQQMRNLGIDAGHLCGLFPVHPNRTDWNEGHESAPYSDMEIINLAPEEWYKPGLLSPARVSVILAAYYAPRGLRVESVAETEHLNTRLDCLSDRKFHDRLKRVFQVQVRDNLGVARTRYVLAKSVGWGWLSYNAFLCGERLAGFVTPVLGLRDGILYSEWVSDAGQPESGYSDVQRAAEYVAARVQTLRMEEDPSPSLAASGQHRASDELVGILSRAYGWKMACVLARPRLLKELLRTTCPVPTLIDGRMRPLEWVRANSSLLKSDFEHHGQGKTELGITDPAYDLADMILSWRLTKLEERELLNTYTEISGDSIGAERLLLNKLLAGNSLMSRALDNLKDPRLLARHEEFSRDYLNAFDSLTEHTTEYCASFCKLPERPAWCSPLVMLDIDGVVDKTIFGFPTNTAAGIQSLSLLHAHGFAIAFNSARSLAQMKKYCEAYGAAGAVAEYGAVVWDALTGNERVLVNEESIDELERVRRALRSIPGVFLNDAYMYSIRAFVYQRETTVPLPTVTAQNVLAAANVKHLRLHQTFTDTTIVAGGTDKGRGLRALLALSGNPDIATIAIGDSAPDLPMFRAASRSFAPSHISCRTAAELIGCRVAARPYQPGVLESVRKIIHPGANCPKCRSVEQDLNNRTELFPRLLAQADRSRVTQLIRVMLDPYAIKAFRI